MVRMSDNGIRVRFAPSPTGYLHIGGARTALFNWLFARRHGGRLVLRIEDTDRNRHIGDSLEKIFADLRWLGLEWDEGPEHGGEFGPYAQSERLKMYQQHLDALLESGSAYYALESPEQLAAMREQAKTEKGEFKYQRPDPLPTPEQGRQAREAGEHVTVRFKMPDRDIVVRDAVLGEVCIPRAELEDFVIQKSDGWPTYHFACVVDDELMGITHVLRGQEHLMNTPKHVAIQESLGFRTPVYAHLSIIFNPDGSKMSKRDKEKAAKKGIAPPEIDVHDFRRNGYLPEALSNFISLLGWSPGEDREQMTLEETTALFSLDRVNPSNAKFDRDKLVAFNTDWAARLSPDRLLAALKDFATVANSPLTADDDQTLAYLLRICKGFRTFRDIETKTNFLFIKDEAIEFDPKAVKKALAKNDGAGFGMLERVLGALQSAEDWTATAMEGLVTRFCESEDVKLGAIAQPLRVAVTGTMVSPPIYDTLALLGRDRTINRIKRTLTMRESLTTQ